MGIYSDVLLTVDFDRTLTAPDSTIPARNIEAIRYFMENGGVFTVNTGRSLPMTQHNILGKCPVNAPLLLYTGSAAYNTETGELELCKPIDLDPTALVEDLQSRFPGLTVEIQGRDAHYIFRKDAGWEDYCENNHCAWDYLPPADIPGPFLKVALYGEFRENTVASMFDGTEEEMELFRQAEAYIEKTYGHAVDSFRACARILDLQAKGCSKISCARTLQATLGRKILVCVGDAPNDIPMLDGADFAFCPGDAELGDRYEKVCDCALGAVADVIYEKIPEILKKQS